MLEMHCFWGVRKQLTEMNATFCLARSELTSQEFNNVISPCLCKKVSPIGQVMSQPIVEVLPYLGELIKKIDN